MNVYDKAHELARALSASKEYRDYKAAKERIEQDETTKRMLKDFKKRQLQLQAAYLSGRQPDEKELDTFKKLSELIQHSPDISNFLQAEYRLNTLMSDIYRILSEAVDMDLDFMQEDEKEGDREK
ncbi:cell fate (sporulation/competence/biofilm development) regulator YlbF (YheA/YmcA/DUF963 family) [Caldicoprobacter guelmensis]|uniref:YlbF family regulator n=1 Tax=Caldicoprobacter guelmensis TaxID=1170224 RepID=UPI001959D92C|nr:YlbF family regulator [Caldicoprobacter guelmensis]MBM7581257.1 cell fate (sporulation/competence/biofilm development) regulator YlbF (YheA/YmcA/DUF963 family) [Caldicoprobacter guelmensis]